MGWLETRALTSGRSSNGSGSEPGKELSLLGFELRRRHDPGMAQLAELLELHHHVGLPRSRGLRAAWGTTCFAFMAALDLCGEAGKVLVGGIHFTCTRFPEANIVMLCPHHVLALLEG